ncbi:hypothetical protein CUPS4066_02590 [Campylobacter upsaliensis]|uniref:hypothetical protein n=1 Tax=Campylobacter upsaliensis TaxID=28080 RepID=UPI00004B3222|nr:hypothetical protein [Campylobacter upsaliensis]EAL53634.1 hypothetical protein CUP1833 [Campylobacter upsaliensis RM3195]MCR2107600.1 hypothetical protein [Campylobacter upsaliensis]MCR2109681.1 hypothetical protein [Campylobacter upsaliensis]MCR2114850.1 hypothetical protein [Campylobacter upsaliensis]MCR2121896.1 hypothetical protein [Campylobacter upsaliensis]
MNNGYFNSGNGNKPELCAQLGTCGNGKIVNEGGSITIDGKLTNESFDDNKIKQIQVFPYKVVAL